MTVPDPSSLVSSPRNTEEPSVWLWGAMLVSLAALAGSLYLTIGMNLKACPLCLYQRTFVMGVVAVLAVGLLIKDLRPGALSLLALPLAVGALVVAGWHEYLEQTGALECPHGVLGYGTAPQQSLVVLAALTALLILDQLRPGRWLGVLATCVLGVLLAYGGIKSALPAIPNYNLPVDEDMCRKPGGP
jgi:disulfide bond formation protein DsbB